MLTVVFATRRERFLARIELELDVTLCVEDPPNVEVIFMVKIEHVADAAERHGVSLSAWLNAAAERALLIRAGPVGR